MTKKKKLLKEEKEALVRYFKLLIKAAKRLKKEMEANPTIVDYLEPEFCLLLAKY